MLVTFQMPPVSCPKATTDSELEATTVAGFLGLVVEMATCVDVSDVPDVILVWIDHLGKLSK